MTDVFSKEERSKIMSRIRSKETKAEKVVFKFLRREKIYFQKHYNRVAGKPDIALPRKKRAIFIDGDFWHGRKLKTTIDRLPKDYWQGKIAGNVARDKKIRRELRKQGWQILRIWETDVLRKKTQQEELEKIAKFLKT